MKSLDLLKKELKENLLHLDRYHLKIEEIPGNINEINLLFEQAIEVITYYSSLKLYDSVIEWKDDEHLPHDHGQKAREYLVKLKG